MASNTIKYRDLLLRLLPRGKAWESQPENLKKLFKAFGGEACRVERSLLNLIIKEANPNTTSQLLEDWERLVGIPDECTDPAGTDPARRAQVVQKLTSRGGQNEAFFLQVALSLGVEAEIEIDSAEVFRVGRNRMGDRLNGLDWQFVWIVRTDDFVQSFFRTGQNRMGDRLREFGNETLECTMQKLKPAHTQVNFSFGG